MGRGGLIRGNGPLGPQIGGGNLPPPRFAGTEARTPDEARTPETKLKPRYLSM